MEVKKIQKRVTHQRIDWLPSRVSILGIARSGVAAAKFFIQKGITPFISDSCSLEKMISILSLHGIEQCPYEADGHSQRVLDSDLIVLSPGIPSDIAVLKKAQERNIPIWSEIELGYRHSIAPVLAVTGSTGKSTTVSLLGSILQSARIDHIVCGNIGLPLIEVAHRIPKMGRVIAEISSFQLENIDLFKPKVAAVLNLMKNHLDRYTSIEEYFAAKKSIINRMDDSDTLIVNAHDKELQKWIKHIEQKLKIVFFGSEYENHDCVWVSDNFIVSKFGDKRERIVSTDSLLIPGNHNVENACAATAIALATGVDTETIAAGLKTFKGLPHRLEFIDEINQVLYYNDSKATTAESVACAVNSFKSKVHLIAGGRDKGCDFSLVKDSILNRVKSACLIGEAADRMYQSWKGTIPLQKTDSLELALQVIGKNVGPGDVVILSPGCSSFDMFQSFEERGDIFKRLVKSLKRKG